MCRGLGDNMAIINGTSAKNTLVGTNANDVINGLGDDDILIGKLGADKLDGGAGFDFASYTSALSGLLASLASSAGNTGEAAGDTYISIEGLIGSAFNDTLIGNTAKNTLRGGEGNDTLIGGLGADILDGGNGSGDYASYINATAGLTVSLASPGSNTGEAAGDTYIGIERLAGSAFNDVLIGDNSNNVLRGNAGADVLNGMGGFDTASYFSAPTGLTASLINPSDNTGHAAGDTYISIENLSGSTFKDILRGNAGSNWLFGQAGADTLDGGDGYDYAAYGDSTVGLTVSLANAAANTDEAAGDTFISIEGLSGSSFNDQLIGNQGDNWLLGGLGADKLDGGAGFDYAAYFNATSAVTASLASPASNTGEAAGDTYLSIEGLSGSQFNDTLRGDGANNWLNGREGADLLDGGIGFDYASYNYATVGVRASLANAAVNTGEAAGDAYVAIEALSGSGFNDELIGDGTGNWLRGNAGADILNGQGGEDTASYWSATAAVKASLAAPGTNTGEAAGDTYISIERLAGSQFNDTLTGDAGNNWLVGERGADKLLGGAGTDTAAYHNSAGGLTASLASSAANTGEAAGDSYNSIENLYGTGFADTLIGNTAANWLGGNSGDDTLIGGKGADTLDGGAGADYASYLTAASAVKASLAAPGTNTGDAAGDTYISIERLAGSQFNDVLTGDAFSNTLRGNGGADKLDGGAGFDYASYFGAAVGVTVSLANSGLNSGDALGDTFVSIEGLSGSAFADHLIGDSGDNWLAGNGGADKLDGGVGIDTAFYNNATAGVTASLVNPSTNTAEAVGDTYISIENLSGSNFNDTLRGDGASNVLRGNLGADLLDGQGGFDTASYAGSSAGVTVSLATPASNTGEAFGDTYLSIEGIIGSDFDDALTGNAAANTMSGGSGNDALAGGAGNDTLKGESGDDVLVGGNGNDILSGNSGKDQFVFNFAPNAASNLDLITDFSVVDDTIVLENAIFTAFATTGAIASGAFHTGAAAQDANDRLIYNKTTGDLFYDTNGSGSGGSVQIAELSAGLSLTYEDFLIV